MSFDPVPIVASIENIETANRLKLADEDAAAVYPDPARRLVVLEGYSHRYVIRGEDVVDCTLNRRLNVQGVHISFRVCSGPVVLKLRLVQVSVSYALSPGPARPAAISAARSAGKYAGDCDSPIAGRGELRGLRRKRSR